MVRRRRSRSVENTWPKNTFRTRSIRHRRQNARDNAARSVGLFVDDHQTPRRIFTESLLDALLWPFNHLHLHPGGARNTRQALDQKTREVRGEGVAGKHSSRK